MYCIKYAHCVFVDPYIMFVLELNLFSPSHGAVCGPKLPNMDFSAQKDMRYV